MNEILHLATVYEVLIYCQSILAVVGYWKEEEEIGEYTTLYSPLFDHKEWENHNALLWAFSDYSPVVWRGYRVIVLSIRFFDGTVFWVGK